MSESHYVLPSDSNHENGNGWPTWSKLVLSEIERLQTELDKANVRLALTREQDLPALRTEIAVLKTKAVIFGAIAGIVSSALASAILNYFIHPPVQ